MRYEVLRDEVRAVFDRLSRLEGGRCLLSMEYFARNLSDLVKSGNLVSDRSVVVLACMDVLIDVFSDFLDFNPSDRIEMIQNVLELRLSVKPFDGGGF